MAHHVFYPSPELPHQVTSYASGMQAQSQAWGSVTGNAAADLAPLVTAAQALAPQADAIEQKQLELAALLDAYHKAAAPLWEQFSERLHYAHTYGEKHKLGALLDFLKGFRHNQGRHAAKKAHDHKHGAAAAQPPAQAPKA